MIPNISLPGYLNSISDLVSVRSQVTYGNARFPLVSSLHRIHGKNKEIQYLDLDLDSTPENGNHSTASNSESSLTVYKEVDFVKTEAFNRTKQKVEQERNNAQL